MSIPQVSSDNQQQRVNLYNQLNQQAAPVVPSPGTTTTAISSINQNPGNTLGTNGTYDYQTAIANRLNSIKSVGTAALDRVRSAQPKFPTGSIIPANYVGPKGNAERNAIVKFGEQFQGQWYKWGGSNPQTGFDCSGLVKYVYGKFGLNLPRVSNQQAMVGRRVGIGSLKPGDLVAWDDSSRNKGADHIAIYVGNGYVMEAPHTGAQLRIRRLGSGGFDSTAWGVSLSQYLG